MLPLRLNDSVLYFIALNFLIYRLFFVSYYFVAELTTKFVENLELVVLGDKDTSVVETR